jgi:hypothetical protein
MISTVFDQVQKLFGKGLAIAAFVPSLLLLIVTAYLWFGPEQVARELRRVQAQPLDKATPEILLALGVVWLLAYVLYGVRGALHGLFQGRFPLPLAWLGLLLLAKERWVRRRRQARLDQKDAERDVPVWAMEKQFGPTFSRAVLTPRLAKARLKRARAKHEEILKQLQTKRGRPPGKYRQVLTEAHLLQANRKRLPPALQEEVDRFVAEVRDAYDKNAPLRQAAKELLATVDREWVIAYSRLHEDFPEEEFLQPTRLGNVAMLLERYPWKRYGLPLSELWPRLAPLLGDTPKRVEDANIYLDFTVIMALCSLVGAAVGVTAVFRHPPDNFPGLEVLPPLALLLGFGLFYRLAIEATRSFGLQLQAVVDHNRFKLLDALHVARPKTPGEEKALWDNLHSFFAQADLKELKDMPYTTAGDKGGGAGRAASP